VRLRDIAILLLLPGLVLVWVGTLLFACPVAEEA